MRKLLRQFKKGKTRRQIYLEKRKEHDKNRSGGIEAHQQIQETKEWYR